MSKQARLRVAACSLLLSAMAAAGAAPVTYTAILDGPSESPPNTSPGIGATQVIFDDTAHTLMVSVAFAGLLGDSTASHIHCCTTVPGSGTAGIATETPTFAGFPLGVNTGAFSHTYDTSMNSTWNSSFLSSHGGTAAGAEAAFNAGLMAGEAYLNIHSTSYPGGEIRGFLMPVSAVPEPASLAMLAAGIPLVLLARRRRS
jgi:hypothetical protein